MAGFTKLFQSIIHSTIWRAEPSLKILWVTMLAMADREGVVESSLPGLADAARISLEDCEEGLNALSRPDQHSRTQDFEGRRIMPADGGWVILNYIKYRETRSDEETRAKTRERVRRFRDKTARNASVTPCNAGNAIADAEAEAVPTPTPSRGRVKGPVVLADYPAEMLQAVGEYRALMTLCRSEAVLNRFPKENHRFIAKSLGANAATWRAWQKHLGKSSHGAKVENADVLEALLLLIDLKRKHAEDATSLAIPMLPSLLNQDIFIDALVKVMEAAHAS